jgi:uncharacterized coiled-coil protein SlyX
MVADTSQDELEALRRRVAELEEQLAEQQRATAQLVARSQEKLYWADRLGIDLNRLMARPGAMQALGALKAVRSASWAVKRTVRRVRGR